MKLLTTLLSGALFCVMAYGQVRDTAGALALAARCKTFDADKADSLLIYSEQIARFAQKKMFKQGISDAMRFRGMYYEYTGKYDSAINTYLKNLDYARQHLPPQKANALYTDLISVYKTTQQYGMVKQYALTMYRASEQIADTPRLSSALLNLGVGYRALMQYDSAEYYYKKTLWLKERLGDSAGMANLRINLSAFYYGNGKYQDAFNIVLPNVEYHARNRQYTDLWRDYTNLATALLGLKQYAPAKNFLDKSVALLDSSSAHLADTYELYAELYAKTGNYKLAFEFKEKAMLTERATVNENTNRIMAEAAQKFEAGKKQQQNLVLAAQLEKSNLQKRNLAIIAISAALLALLVLYNWLLKKKANRLLTEKNEVIRRQVEKLSELNTEKNALISMVSHDLASPLSAIHVWTQVLEKKGSGFTNTQQEALEQIRSNTEKGQQLVRRVLDVEKAEQGIKPIQLEPVNLYPLLEEIRLQFHPAATNKGVHIVPVQQGKETRLLSDKQMLARILENLVSNAVKFTPAGKNIYLQVQENDESVTISVRDEGVGIATEELSRIFHAHGHISSATTAGETSTGIGLSIAQRLAGELNARLTAESEPGVGSRFTLTLKK